MFSLEADGDRQCAKETISKEKGHHSCDLSPALVINNLYTTRGVNRRQFLAVKGGGVRVRGSGDLCERDV